jgi:hypothetical protein
MPILDDAVRWCVGNRVNATTPAGRLRQRPQRLASRTAFYSVAQAPDDEYDGNEYEALPVSTAFFI